MPTIVKGRAFTKEPWYGTYRSMMCRCYNPKSANYGRYGGRGIKVCEEWHKIEMFEEWVKKSNFKPGLSIDRIDSNGDYSPNNCKWSTPKEQANNRTNTVYLDIGGVKMSVSDWSAKSGINRNTLIERYYDGVRGHDLLRKPQDTKFRNGYNRYSEKRKHYSDYPQNKKPTMAVKYVANGEEHTLREWSELTGISIATMYGRIQRGWSVEKSVNTPPAFVPNFSKATERSKHEV